MGWAELGDIVGIRVLIMGMVGLLFTMIACHGGFMGGDHPPQNLIPPIIVVQPADQTVTQGDAATFQVVAEGSAPLSYQWRKNGVDLPGATGITLVIPGAQFGDAGVYTVVVSNPVGSVTSDAALLTVTATGLPPTIITHPADQTVAQGQPVSFHVVADGTSPLSYQWRKEGVDLPGVIGDTLSLASAQPSDVGSYTVVVSNAFGSVESYAATLALGTPPVIMSRLAYLAGNVGGPGSLDGVGRTSRFNQPEGVAVDGSGNAYVADYGNHTIRKITAAGVVTTLAGSWGNPGYADGLGATARFSSPQDVAVDSAGNIYVADSDNQCIRKIAPDGVVSTLAGTPGTPGDTDGPNATAEFDTPQGVAVDDSGNVYVADTFNHTIRRISSGGEVSTIAGLAGSFGSADGSGTAARFDFPMGVAVDGAGHVFVADTFNSTIREISPGGVVSTLAGVATQNGSLDGLGASARFNEPNGVAVGGDGNIYVADTKNFSVRKITPAGEVSTLAGDPNIADSVDGIAVDARFRYPWGVAVDSFGVTYVTDYSGNTVRKIAPSGNVTTWAGNAVKTGTTDGPNHAARFYNPLGVAVDVSGIIYVADAYNHTVRKILPSGEVSTLAGIPGNPGSTDGPASTAQFNFPMGLAVDGPGNVYVADANNDTIRKITPDGMVSTLAGLAGASGSADGDSAMARFNIPTGVALDSDGYVYVTDRSNHTLRKITPGGEVTTLAGLAETSGSADGLGNLARFNNPTGVALDPAGNLYVTDSGNYTLRRVKPDGTVSTLAGAAGSPGSQDGLGSLARFDWLMGVAVDASGNRIFVPDPYNGILREVDPDGMVTTLAGQRGDGGSQFQGGPLPAHLGLNRFVAVTPDGDLVLTVLNGLAKVIAP